MTHNVDEGREEHQEDGKDAHQSAVQPGLDDALGQRLQRHWEELQAEVGGWGRAETLSM